MGNISTNHKKIKLDDIVPPKIELPDDVIYDMLNNLPDKSILKVSKLNKRSGQLAKDVNAKASDTTSTKIRTLDKTGD